MLKRLFYLIAIAWAVFWTFLIAGHSDPPFGVFLVAYGPLLLFPIGGVLGRYVLTGSVRKPARGGSVIDV